jgi:hypothetical protein
MFKKNKNMKKLFLNFAIVMLLPVMAGQVSGQQQSMKKNVNSKKEKAGTLPDNTLSRKEKKEGWKLLFNGNTADEWMNPRTKKFPESGWEIKDGVLLVNPATKTQGGGGDIVSVKTYRNFDLTVDFKYTPGANSGIKYFVDIESNNGSLAGIGCEYQVLDDKLHPDAKLGKDGDRTLAGLYDLIPPKKKIDNGPENWNRAEIIVRGNKVQHWLNGQLTVEYERSNDAWRALVATSKFKDSPGFGEVQDGRILLQDHGNLVYYKNIKIKELK